MSISHANATWEGDLSKGRGVMKPGHAPEVPFSLKTRMEGAPGSNPEEMIGAALAGCFSMALSHALTQAGTSPQQIKTEAAVRLDQEGGGFKISKIELTTEVRAPGLDAAKFEAIAQETKKQCPVSKALSGTEITLRAKIAG